MNDVPALELRDVASGYLGSNVIRGVSLSVRPGNVAALLGPNGAGKTTTLRTVCGLLPCSRGQVLLGGEDLAGVSPQTRARRGVVMVSDRRGIFAGLTVAEHFKLRYPGQKLHDDDVFDLFPALAKLRARRAGLLSGGEQQMLGLARAFARRPQVLMIDEMSLGLAPVIVERLLPMVRRIAEELSSAVLLVEQHVHLALQTADYGYVLSHGDLVLEGAGPALARDTQLIAASYLGGT